MPAPPALAEMNSSLQSGQKYLLTVSLTGNTPCPDVLQPTDIGDKGTLIVDGQALVIAVGKLPKVKTFGDLADPFVTSVLQAEAMFNRVDIIFDRYYNMSTRERNSQRKRLL